ncbi:MAG: M28 family peptidase, partial [Candidatus Zixiibacteriota bacterium]
ETMLTRFLALLITLTVLSPMALADDNFLIIVDNQSGDVQKTLTGFPGRCWGKTPDKIYLAGGEDEISWLRARHIDFDAVRFDDETSFLYLWYLDKDRLPVIDFEILDYGPGYILTSATPKEAIPFRRLSLRPLPFTTRDLSFDRILEFDPYIDSLINEVSQDTLVDFLSGLSGETPVVVNGQLDTIRTRYSGEPDNFLAAEYLKEKLEGYGYVVEYHQFFGGGMRHTAAYDENLAWVVSEGSQAFRTTDGGATWQMMPDNTSSSLWGVTNVGPDSVWIAGNNGVILFSSDGGDSFTLQYSGTSVFLFGVCFINSAEGWIAGDVGRILHTANSGQNWSTQTTPTSSRLYDVCFVDSQYGWAVGRSGTIIHTDNGGATWIPQTSNTSERLYSVDFIDRENGWVVGWSGVVRHTTDGGTTWQTVNLGSYNYKYHVDFPDLMHGCIVGWDGEIFVTTDGGTTWQQKSSGTSKDFYGVEFVDTLTGFAVGGGIIEKTTDGGETWVNQTGGIEGAWRNVIATKTGAVRPDQEVIICGHFDDYSEQPQVRAPGADDNGSGSSAVVDAARIFAGVDFERTVKFCLWNGEEQGLLGSAAYAEEAYARGDDILGVFNFDMIAWDGNGDTRADLHCGTMSSSIALGEILEGVITDYGLDLDPELITFGSSGASDHASFWDYNYAAMLGIEDFDDFNPYYHTTGDNLSHIMPDYFTEFVKASVGGVATFAVPAEVSAVREGTEQLPKALALRQNHPNPFNPRTEIRYVLPTGSHVRLEIYNLAAQWVQTLFDGQQQPGTHSVVWDGSGTASGIYFYKLTAGNSSEVKRMTLLK